MMKNTAWLAFVFIALLGCSAFREMQADLNACINNAECRKAAAEEAIAKKEIAVQLAGIASPVPWAAPVAGATVGLLWYLLTAIKKGKKLRKQNDVA